MSDYPNSNIQRSSGTSGRGLLITFATIVGVVVLLALIGSLGGDGDDAPAPQDTITPAEPSPVLPTE